jgi:hypothetical protein
MKEVPTAKTGAPINYQLPREGHHERGRYLHKRSNSLATADGHQEMSVSFRNGCITSASTLFLPVIQDFQE